MAVDARLVERARRPGLAPLWDELARRFASSPRPVSSVTLRGLADAERRALADLLARPRLPDATTSVRLDHVAAAFGIGAEHLRPLVEALRGPLGDRAADRRRDRDDRAALWRWLEEEAARRGIEEWARRVRSLGVPGGDVGAHRERLQAVLAVIDAVAALDRTRPPVPLAVLANDVLGDPHALDPGAALTGPVVDAVAALAGVEVPTAAEGVRPCQPRGWSPDPPPRPQPVPATAARQRHRVHGRRRGVPRRLRQGRPQRRTATGCRRQRAA